jgi:hypothetical protein
VIFFFRDYGTPRKSLNMRRWQNWISRVQQWETRNLARNCTYILVPPIISRAQGRRYLSLNNSLHTGFLGHERALERLTYIHFTPPSKGPVLQSGSGSGGGLSANQRSTRRRSSPNKQTDKTEIRPQPSMGIPRRRLVGLRFEEARFEGRVFRDNY